MNSNEWHVCSLVVQISPEVQAMIIKTIEQISDAAVVGVKENEGKLVVVLEAVEAQSLFKRIESIQQISGVLAVSLVYHQQDNLGEVMP